MTLPAPSRDPRLLRAADALAKNRLDDAEPALAAWLEEHPADPYALRMMAELLGRLGRYRESEGLLARALVIAPGFDAARFNYALVLHRQSKTSDAMVQIDRLLTANPDHPGYRNLKAAMQARLGEYDAAIHIYERLLTDYPQNPRGHMSHGHALKTMGRSADCITAYRTAVAQAPTLGEAWWSLANLKTLRFSDADIAAMQAALATPGLSDDDRLHLDFALGKALEDRADYARSFAHYSAGNARRRAQLRWDGAANHAHVLANERVFTADFLAARAGQGCSEPDPIFIVGLPRSGSTLIEQILASHSQVEGTMELPDIAAIARGLSDRLPGRDPLLYLDALVACDDAGLTALGQDYLDRTRIQRKTDRPHFIDKMPNNFAYIGLIHLALPNAIIIDARRGAVATCFSAWKQHFARGQSFTYDLAELGAYYADYVRLMAHFDSVLPGRVLRVQYEDMVTDTEAQVRRLLAHCRLDFEPGCLAFHENRRPVRTASSEQVRQPINSDGIDQWRHFEPWLGDLKATVGDA
ncbi:MAG: sulfotransferase [Polymorphobacter sp.]